jgi:hypothetical protein
MNLENISPKQLSELESLLKELLAVMRKAKLQNEPLAEAARSLESELGRVRRERFDAANPEYRGF